MLHQRKLMRCFACDTDSFLITDDSGESTLNEAAAQAEAGERKGDRAGQPLASAYIRFKLLSLHVGQFRDRVAHGYVTFVAPTVRFLEGS